MAKKAEVIITCDASTVKQVLEGLNREMEKTNQRRQQLQQKQQAGIRLTKAEEKELQQLVKYENALAERQQKATGEMRKFGEVMKDLAGSKTKDLKRALNEGKRALDNMSAKDPNRQQLINDLKQIQKQIERNTAGMKSFGATHNTIWQTAVRNITAYMGVFAGFNFVKSKLTEIIQKNREFSDQLANIRKVSGLAMKDINQLATNLAKIDTRSSVQELNQLAYAGSKLGFGNYGIEGLEAFVKSAVKVQNALKEDMGEDAMTALSKMVEVMGLIPKMGVEKAMDATGSAIFKLASTSTATGTNIVEFSKRLMGLANIAHITTPELLAIGSAADSMALMPEVAATAFNKLITAVQKQPNLIENALHIDKGTISDLYQAGHMTDALVMIFEKMREKGGMNALMQSGVFKDLGSDGARLVAVMATMANRVDILQQHLQTSRQAFEEHSAVAQEYAIQMETAEAYMERAANMWTKAFVNPEGVDLTKEFAQAWYDVSKSLTQTQASALGIKIVMTSLFTILKLIVQLLPSIILGFSAWGVTAGMTAVITWVRNLGGLMVALRTAMAAISWTGWAGIITGAAMALMTFVQYLDLTNESLKKNHKFMDGFKKDLSDLNTEYGRGEAELRRYRKAIDEATTGTKQRQAAIAQFNNKFKPYLSNLLTEKSTALDVAKAYNEICKQMRTKLALQLKEKDIQEHVLPREQWTAERRQEYEERAKAAGLGQYGSAWITGYAQDNATKSIDQMVREIGKQYYNLPQKVIDEIAVQAKMGNSEFNNYGNIINSSYLKQANALLAANAYLRQNRSAENAMRNVNQKWKPEQDAMDAMLAAQNQEETYTPLTPARDKEAEKALTKAQRAEKKRLKEEMEEAQKDSTAVINSIEEFYRLQESAIEQLVADGKMTREEADRTINYIRNRKDQMLLEARRAITGNENDFAELRKTMNKDLLRPTDTASRRAMQTVQTVDVAKAAQNLMKFDGGKNVYGLNSGSFTQSVLKNAAQNELNIQRRQAAMATEMEKILMQYEYVEQAQKKFGGHLVKLGLITEGYDKVVQQLADGTEIVANTRDVQALSEKVIGMGARLFEVNPDDSEALANFVSEVVTDAQGLQEEWAGMFPDLDKWMEKPEEFKQAMQAFYQTLLDYDTAYYNARKQQYELYKKENQQMWEESGRKEFYDQTYTQLQNQQTQQDVFGTGQTFGQQYGLADAIANDPEVELYKQKLQAAAEYYQFVESHQHTEQELREAGQATLEAFMAMAKKVGDEVAERAAKIQELQQPVTDFAEEAGQKLGDMLFNMESQSMTWNQIIKKMILSFAQMTVKMAAENLTKKIQQALFYKQMQAMEIEHQTTMLGIQTAFGAMQIGAQQSINTTKQVAQTADNTATVAKEVSLATILTQLGISEGAAKTIGALGWWGIPLVAVISSLLLGLLSSALSTAGSESTATSSSTSTSTPKTKLVSGMLTYDKGNVQRFIGQDGKVYTATEEPQPRDGLVTRPIATTVQGQPALVAEKGPEIVIGRETTEAIMMNEPELIRYIANYDRHGGKYGLQAMRAYDSGNVGQMADGGVKMADVGGNPLDADTLAALRMLPTVMNALTEQLKKPVYINKYGTGGLIEEVKSGLKFDKRYNG